MFADWLNSNAHHSEQMRCNPLTAPSVVFIATAGQNEILLFRQCCVTYSSSIGPSFLNYFSLDGDYKDQYEAIGDMIERPVYDVLGRPTNSSIALYSEQGITRSNSLPLLAYCFITMSLFFLSRSTFDMQLINQAASPVSLCCAWIHFMGTVFQTTEKKKNNSNALFCLYFRQAGG